MEQICKLRLLEITPDRCYTPKEKHLTGETDGPKKSFNPLE
jgi:hypothetical protein